jgi:hypothetical protein
MRDYDPFTLEMLRKQGFDTDAKLNLRARVLLAIRNRPDFDDRCWQYTDAYGEPGLVPPQGWDWSAYRDSSWPAIKAMADEIGFKL